MIIYIIYSLVENKIYVGKTTKSLHERIRFHKSACRRGDNSSKLLYEAVRHSKNEWSDFIWFEIDSASSYEELNEKEKFWIKTLNTQEFGYNIGFGGDGGDNFTFNLDIEEIKKKISEGVVNSCRWTGVRRKEQSIRTSKMNQENLEFLRNRMLGELNPMAKEEFRRKLIGELNPMKNSVYRERHLKAVQSESHRKFMSDYKKTHPSRSYERTEEHRRKLSERRKGTVMSLETKKKISETLKGRKFSEETKMKIASKISGIIRSEETKRKISELKKNRIFLQFSKDGKFLNRYLGKTEVKEKIGVSVSNIKDSRFFPTRMAGGYKWIILKKDENTEEEIQKICRKGL